MLAIVCLLAETGAAVDAARYDVGCDTAGAAGAAKVVESAALVAVHAVEVRGQRDALRTALGRKILGEPPSQNLGEDLDEVDAREVH